MPGQRVAFRVRDGAFKFSGRCWVCKGAADAWFRGRYYCREHLSLVLEDHEP